ncbi:HD domain-containing protein [Suillus lakei]|nr:HD domain-containing protein [Suillus lakei]
MDESEIAPPAKRVFPPLYVSTGDASIDRLAFFHVLERLKTQKRTGWVDNKIPNAESISDHMYRMAILAMCTSDNTLDVSKCVMMAVVHDLAEAQVGDITPREGICKQEKQRLEAVSYRTTRTPSPTSDVKVPYRKRYIIWSMICSMVRQQRYESRLSGMNTRREKRKKRSSSKVCLCVSYLRVPSIHFDTSLDLDRLEMALQAREYEMAHALDLQPFFDSSLPRLRHPEVKRWGEDLARTRPR